MSRRRGTATRAVARMPFKRFIGPVMVGQAFDVDGRGSDYEFVYGWDPEEVPLWVSEDGEYAVHALPYFEPDTTVLRHAGETVGFYMGGELWIDEAHRGKGLAPEMILATVEWLGKVPFDNEGGIGFSPAGYAAHRRAHAIAVERASGARPMPPRPEAIPPAPTP